MSSGSATTARRSRSSRSCARRWPTPGRSACPIVDHPEETGLTEGAEANDGFVATVLGLRGWPVAAEEVAVARDLAVLADVVRDVPGARLHLTHVSSAGALELIRRAKAAGLPVTCDVTPHHLALTDEWVAGARRWAWDASGDPWADDAMRASAYDSEPPGQPAAPRARGRRGRAGRPGRRHGRCGRHGPRAAHRGGQGGRIRVRGQRHQRHRDGAGPAAGRRGRRPAAARAGHRGADDRTVAGARRAIAAQRVGRARRGRAGRPGRLRSLGLVARDRRDGLLSRGKNSPLARPRAAGAGPRHVRGRPGSPSRRPTPDQSPRRAAGPARGTRPPGRTRVVRVAPLPCRE